jgi:hypothetical protein
MNKIKVVAVVMFIVIGFMILIVKHLNYQKKYDDLLLEYPLLTKQESLKGIVQNKFDFKTIGFRQSGLASFVNINGRNYRIFAEEFKTENWYGINTILSVGDSIIKQSNSDSIFVKKTNGRQYLVIRRDTEFE